MSVLLDIYCQGDGDPMAISASIADGTAHALSDTDPLSAQYTWSALGTVFAATNEAFDARGWPLALTPAAQFIYRLACLADTQHTDLVTMLTDTDADPEGLLPRIADELPVPGSDPWLAGHLHAAGLPQPGTVGEALAFLLDCGLLADELGKLIPARPVPAPGDLLELTDAERDRLARFSAHARMMQHLAGCFETDTPASIHDLAVALGLRADEVRDHLNDCLDSTDDRDRFAVLRDQERFWPDDFRWAAPPDLDT